MSSIYKAIAKKLGAPVYVVKCLDDDYPCCMRDEVYLSADAAMKACVQYRLFNRHQNPNECQWLFEVCFYPSLSNYVEFGNGGYKYYCIDFNDLDYIRDTLAAHTRSLAS